MRQYSIRSKLLWITIALFLTTVIAFSTTVWTAISQSNQQISTHTQMALSHEIKEKLTAIASQYSERIDGFINEAYRVPYSLASILANNENAPFSRESAQQAAKSTLASSEQLSSLYAQFEQNGFDNQDHLFRSNTTHSVVGAGSFEVYFVKDNQGQITQEIVDDAAEKHDATVNEFGIRNAEWYLCAMDTLKPCLMEPYLYEITEGQTELMTSLTVPIIKDNQFVGVVGADLNLPIFQTFIDELSDNLYAGRSKVSLLSAKGLIVASSHYDKKARPLSEAMDATRAATLSTLHNQQKYLLDGQTIVVAQPITMPLSDSTWSIIIEIDSKDAFSSALALQDTMKSDAANMNTLLLVLGLTTTTFAVFCIWLLTRSIVAPVTLLRDRMEHLASEDGDLTQSIEVFTHAELISLGNGFNNFRNKLKSLISDLKIITVKSQQESAATEMISRNINENITGQHQEIENVVTAVNQMSSTALEVAKASEQTANEADAMANNVRASQENLAQAMEYVSTMSAESIQAKEAVIKVSQSSDNISSIVEVIRAIADQTNLLALNAAIEAARAGEQGRGFAVVADEVRSLASKTQESTNNITRLIESLHQEVDNASQVIEKGTEHAEAAVSKTDEALGAIDKMVEQISQVSNQVTQIATAAEEQSAVTEEVNRNITSISTSTAKLATYADEAYNSSASLAKLVASQEQQLTKLKT